MLSPCLLHRFFLAKEFPPKPSQRPKTTAAFQGNHPYLRAARRNFRILPDPAAVLRAGAVFPVAKRLHPGDHLPDITKHDCPSDGSCGLVARVATRADQQRHEDRQHYHLGDRGLERLKHVNGQGAADGRRIGRGASRGRTSPTRRRATRAVRVLDLSLRYLPALYSIG